MTAERRTMHDRDARAGRTQGSEMTSVPATQDISKALISEVAMEIGKDLVSYIERQYPDVWEQMNGGAKLSFRNHVHNDIMSVLACRTEAEYREWIDRRKIARRKLMKLVRANRSGDRDKMLAALRENMRP